jgi:acetylxylan esterase
MPNMRRRRCSLSALLLMISLLLASSSAHAASLQPVQNFGSNPSNLNMFIYVPSKLASTPPIVVAIHYCGGSAQAFFTGGGSGLVTGADQYGYIVIFPETVSTTNNKCWDVFSNASLMHNGGSDSAGIISMVKYTISTYGADANRVYAMGTSSGAMMTNVLLAAYPDVFKAGSAWSGVADSCFAGSSYWNSACANGQTMKTGQQWGDIVRAADPGYSGYRPRMQLWHGDADMTINFNNFGEEIKQWTNVLGVSETPSTTEQNTPQSGDTRTRYTDACGIARVEAVREAGQGHNLNVLGSEVIRFFGLATTGADPGLAGCTDGGGGTIGTGQDAGSDAGGARDGGIGSSSSGGGSMGGRDGAPGIGPEAGGSGSSGGGLGSGGANGEGGAPAGGSGPAGGSSGSAAGGAQNSDAGAWNPDSGTAGKSGCACDLGGDRGRPGALAALLVAGLSVLRVRRQRARRSAN